MLPVYTVCEPCGALIHDEAVHAEFHARLDASAQHVQEMVAQGMAVLHALSPDTVPAPSDPAPVGPITGRPDSRDLPPAAAGVHPPSTKGTP